MKALRLLGLVGGIIGLACAGASAKDWKTVRIGMDATYPPFESVDPSGKIVGFEVDYATELCSRMKVTCEFQNQDWDGIIPALLAGKFDVILSAMNETPQRAKMVSFSIVYLATAPVWVAQPSEKSDDTSPAAMKGKVIGTQSSTVFSNFVTAKYPGVELKQYPGGDEPFADLASGRLDYVVSDVLVAQKLMEKMPGCCRIVKEIPRDPEIFGPGVAAAFRPSDPDLKEMFNKAMADVQADGTFKRLEAKYFKIDISPKS